MAINLDNFKKYSFEILTLISEEFPKPRSLNFVDIYEAEEDEAEEMMRFHLGAISFLMQEEYIYNANKSSDLFSLTSKGAALFNEDIANSLKQLLS